MINILVSSNKKYLKPLQVMLYSLSRQIKDEEVNVYFINVTLSECKVLKLKKYIENMKNFKFTLLSVDKSRMSQLPLLAHLSIETYARLFLLDLLPSALDKILWLDADIIVNNHIAQFYNQDLSDKYAAVCQSINDDSKSLLKNLGLNLDQKYFNAGVILFNLKTMRADFNAKYFIDYAIKNINKIKWLDQDILNATIGHRCIFCDYKKYNYMHFSNQNFSDGELKWIKENNVFLHYIGAVKPWESNFEAKTRQLWINYAKQSKLYGNLYFIKYNFDHFLNKTKKKIKNIFIYFKHFFKNCKLRHNFKSIRIMDPIRTINYIIKSNCSVTRFGDGEMLIIDNEGDIGFQKKDRELAARLNEIISIESSKNCLICIPRWIFKVDSLNLRSKKSKRWCKQYLIRHYSTWCKKINQNYLYGDTSFNRNYIGMKDKSNAKSMFGKLKQIWNDKDVCFVEGSACYLGVGNDLFNNAKSIRRIIAPATNAFDKYEEILDACKKQSKEVLFLIALGPTASVLAYDLAQLGYRAIDIGHVDIEYEWCNMNADYVVPVQNKYTNEAGGAENLKDYENAEYNKQIVALIK